MPAPPLAPLLLQEVVEAPLLLQEVLQALASFARTLRSTTRTFGALCFLLALASFARRLTSTTRTFGAVWSLLGSLACCFPLLGISLLQCKLLLGLLVLLSSTLYQFPALTLGEDVAHVGDVLAPEKLMADLQSIPNCSGCLCLRREGGVVVCARLRSTSCIMLPRSTSRIFLRRLAAPPFS